MALNLLVKRDESHMDLNPFAILSTSHARPNIRLICLIVTISVAVTGCSNIPVVPEQNPAEMPRPNPSSIAVITARFEPVGSSGPLRTKAGSAAQGAAVGGAVGALESLSVAGDPLLALLALSVMVPLGIIIGAAEGASSGSTSDAIENSARTWDKATREARLQQRLRDAVINELKSEYAAKKVLARDDLGPETVGAPPKYNLNDADLALEVAMLEMKFAPYPMDKGETAYSLAITVRARAIDTRNQKVLDEMKHVIRTPAHTATEWLRDNAGLFTKFMDLTMKESAEAIVLEFFRIYYPPSSLESGRAALFAAPYYVLQPEYPPPPRWSRNTQLSGELQPTFRWESFPRAIDINGAGEQAKFSDVTYDIALYSVTENKTPFSVILQCGMSRGFSCPQKPPFTLGPRIYLRTGLRQPEHRLEIPLQPCGQYGWTMRAHFKLNDQPRVTEWSGTYLMHPPWHARRALLTPGGQQMQDWNVNPFLFRAPPENSETCPD